jgi:hypothetical protein
MRSVADGGEHRYCGRGCGIIVGGDCGDVFGSRSWACCLVVGYVGEGHHPQAGASAYVAIHNCVAVVYNGAVDFGEVNRASSIAHCDNREEGM